jgi:hypothetical protein
VTIAVRRALDALTFWGFVELQSDSLFRSSTGVTVVIEFADAQRWRAGDARGDRRLVHHRGQLVSRQHIDAIRPWKSAL